MLDAYIIDHIEQHKKEEHTSERPVLHIEHSHPHPPVREQIAKEESTRGLEIIDFSI